MTETAEDWMWKEDPSHWWASVHIIARFMREAKPTPDGRDALLEILGHEEFLLAVHELGAVLFRILVNKEDARRVFLQDKRKKANQRPHHVRVATTYWATRAIDPGAPDDAAIEAAREVLYKGKRSRGLSASLIRRIARAFRCEVFEDFDNGHNNYGVVTPSAEALQRMREYLRKKVGREKNSEMFPELILDAQERSRRLAEAADSRFDPNRPVDWGAWMLGEHADNPKFDFPAILAERGAAASALELPADRVGGAPKRARRARQVGRD